LFRKIYCKLDVQLHTFYLIFKLKLHEKINIIYWISTGIFGILMLFSAIPDVISSPDALKFMSQLGYPTYFIPFIGVMKVLGVMAILIPLPARLKEWAYAGLAFDLLGAIYSVVGSGLANAQMAFMVIFILPGIVSYIYFHKRIAAARA
jgi:DoxX-like family